MLEPISRQPHRLSHTNRTRHTSERLFPAVQCCIFCKRFACQSFCHSVVQAVTWIFCACCEGLGNYSQTHHTACSVLNTPIQLLLIYSLPSQPLVAKACSKRIKHAALSVTASETVVLTSACIVQILWVTDGFCH